MSETVGHHIRIESGDLAIELHFDDWQSLTATLPTITEMCKGTDSAELVMFFLREAASKANMTWISEGRDGEMDQHEGLDETRRVHG